MKTANKDYIVWGKDGRFASRPLKERFFEKVNKKGPIHPVLKTRCWIWTATKSAGYGTIGINGKTHLVHRVAYRNMVEPIPNGLFVLHKCDNPLCVNPDHLFLGTHKDNMKDRVSKGRGARGEGHGMAKLKEQDVRTIRQLYAEGMSGPQLALRFGVCFESIYSIVHRRKWIHVE